MASGPSNETSTSGRKRNREASSSEYDPATGNFKLEPWIVRQDKFRITAGGVLPVPWPYHMELASSQITQVYLANNLAPEISRILQRENIPETSTKLWSMTRKDFPEDSAEDAVLVLTSSEDTTNWSNAAFSIRQAFTNAGLSQDEFTVEIQNPDRCYQDCSFPLPDNPALLTTIKEIEEDIAKVAREKLDGIWTSIAFHNRGKANSTEDEQTATCIIFCHSYSQANFSIVLEDIRTKIYNGPFPNVELSIEILPGEIMRGELDSIGRITHNQGLNLRNGSSIGPKNVPDSGTLGGWVMWKSDTTASAMPCILTCFHVIENGCKEEKDLNRSKGFKLNNGENSPRKPILVMYPSNPDAKKTLKYCEGVLSRQPSDAVKERVLAFQAQVETSQKRAIARVAFASGMQKDLKSNCRLDWALLECTNDSIRQNQTPELTGLSDREAPPEKVYEYDAADTVCLREALPHILGDDEQNVGRHWVVKEGRSTKVTTGRTNAIPRRVNKGSWNDETMECEIIGIAGQDFAIPGDSGSWIFNEKKELVGMVIGIETRAGNSNCSFYTPISKIMEDIKKTTGGEITLI